MLSTSNSQGGGYEEVGAARYPQRDQVAVLPDTPTSNSQGGGYEEVGAARFPQPAVLADTPTSNSQGCGYEEVGAARYPQPDQVAVPADTPKEHSTPNSNGQQPSDEVDGVLDINSG